MGSPRWGLLRRLGCTDRVGRGDERRDDRIGDPGDRGARGGCPDRERGVPAPTVQGQGLPRLRARDPGGSPFGAAVRIPRRRFRRGHRNVQRLEDRAVLACPSEPDRPSGAGTRRRHAYGGWPVGGRVVG